jgi:alpha-tubulin suppressor-like RCC1 family protein
MPDSKVSDSWALLAWLLDQPAAAPRAWTLRLGSKRDSGQPVAQTLTVPVRDVEKAVEIAAGSNHALALLSDGSMVASGNATSGALGNGAIAIAAVAGCGAHSLALRSDGTVWSWGANNVGQLGDGTTTQRLAPVPVSELTQVKAISSSSGSAHTLALNDNGTVRVGWETGL